MSGYVVAGIASLVILMTFNPSRDVPCDCPSAPFGRFSNPDLLQTAADSTDKVAGAVVLVAVILLVRRLLRANVTERWLLAPLWIVAAVAGSTFIVRSAASFVDLGEHALGIVDDVLNLLTMLVPAAFLTGLLRLRLGASPLGDLVVALGGGTSGETLQRALARTLRDPSVELAYWLPDRDSFVDAAGHDVLATRRGRRRATTLVEREGERLAAIVHDRALLENPRLIEATTAAAGLALDNERLQADLRARIVEVEASRIRIIEASDDARRRIERDLHDGAQQRLLASALSLRMANDRLDDRADPAARRALEDAAAETLVAVAELRDLAHGIHPAVLTEQGLRAAVEDLAERAPIPVAVNDPRRPLRSVDRGHRVLRRVRGPVEHRQARACEHGDGAGAARGWRPDRRGDRRRGGGCGDLRWDGACEVCTTASRRSGEASKCTAPLAWAHTFGSTFPARRIAPRRPAPFASSLPMTPCCCAKGWRAC